MRLAVRVVRAALVVLTVLFAWPGSASVSPVGGARQICTYDAPANCTAAECGPPVAAYVPDFARIADDQPTSDASSRSSGPTMCDT